MKEGSHRFNGLDPRNSVRAAQSNKIHDPPHIRREVAANDGLVMRYAITQRTNRFKIIIYLTS